MFSLGDFAYPCKPIITHPLVFLSNYAGLSSNDEGQSLHQYMQETVFRRLLKFVDLLRSCSLCSSLRTVLKFSKLT